MRKGIICLLALCLLNAPAGASLLWYATDAVGNGWSHLYSLDPLSGQVTDRGVIHGQRHITDLAIDQAGGLWAVGWANAKGNGASHVYSLTAGDADTWAGWSVSSVKAGALQRTVSAAVVHEGAMYAASQAGWLQQLAYNPKKDQWSLTRQADMGYSAAGGLVFSPDGDRAFAALDGGYLASVDIGQDFGRTTIIGHSGYDALSGLAMVDGTLYATTNAVDGVSRLVALDTATGRAGDPLALVQGSIAGLAGAGSANAVPEPMTLAMVAAGGLWLILRSRRRSAA